jgi:hypothetical protein
MARFFLSSLVWIAMVSSVLAVENPAVKFSIADEQLEIEFHQPAVVPGTTLFFALRAGSELGSAVIPFAENFEGSTVFLPFQADRLYLVQFAEAKGEILERRWEKWKWSDRRSAPDNVIWDSARFVFRIPLADFKDRLDLVVYAKDFRAGKTWGRMLGSQDPAVTSGEGDKYIPHYCEIDFRDKAAPAVTVRGRLGRIRPDRVFISFSLGFLAM